MTSHNPKTLREQIKELFINTGASVLSDVYALNKGEITREEYNRRLDDILFPNKAEQALKAFESVLPERTYNDFFEQRKLTPYKQMKARLYVRGYNQAIKEITKAIKSNGIEQGEQ